MPTQNAGQLQVHVRIVDNVAIIDLTGHMAHTTDYRMMTERIHTLIDAGYKNILFNLRGVEHIDSTGTMELLRSLGVTKRRSTTMKITGLISRTRNLLVIGQLRCNFEIYEDEHLAVASFNHKE